METQWQVKEHLATTYVRKRSPHPIPTLLLPKKNEAWRLRIKIRGQPFSRKGGMMLSKASPQGSFNPTCYRVDDEDQGDQKTST